MTDPKKPLVPELLSREDIMAGLPDPPPLPELRMFKVTLSRVDSEGKPTSEYIQAHSVELATFGAAMFFEYTFTTTPNGWAPESRMRRAFAPGVWTDIKEESMMPPSGLIIH